MALYLNCGLCGRKQADGILSRNLWGHLEGTPAGTLRACPRCKEEHHDWERALIEASGVAGRSQPEPA
jgi:hypothetical protein